MAMKKLGVAITTDVRVLNEYTQLALLDQPIKTPIGIEIKNANKNENAMYVSVKGKVFVIISPTEIPETNEVPKSP